MEVLESNEWLCFENNCEAILKVAVAKSEDFVRSLNIDQLPKNKQVGFIEQQLDLLRNEMLLSDRLKYVTITSNDDLFTYFKNLGILNSAEEFKKLENGRILYEKFTRLQFCLIENELRGKQGGQIDKDDPQAMMPGIEIELLYKVLNTVDQQLHLVVAPSTIADWVEAVVCRDWLAPKKPIHVGCMTTELKCVIDCLKRYYPDFNYANIGRSGLFVSKAGIKITANDLSNSVCKNLSKVLWIESFFAILRKKH